MTDKQLTDIGAYVVANLPRPFEWGKFDCAIFVVGWLERNGIEFKLPKYNTEAEARRAMKAMGYDSVADAVDSVLDRAETPRRGDVIMHDGALGVWLYGCIQATPDGLRCTSQEADIVWSGPWRLWTGDK